MKFCYSSVQVLTEDGHFSSTYPAWSGHCLQRGIKTTEVAQQIQFSALQNYHQQQSMFFTLFAYYLFIIRTANYGVICLIIS